MYHQRFKTEDQRWDEKYFVAPNGCWLWKNGGGPEYPKFWIGDRYERASHYSWQKHHKRALKPTDQICHTCDNPRCVNPDHLFVGDHDLNMKDKAMKGRSHHPSGTKNGRAKITSEIADDIRRRYAAREASQDKLAKQYGISQPVVSGIVRNVNWNSN